MPSFVVTAAFIAVSCAVAACGGATDPGPSGSGGPPSGGASSPGAPSGGASSPGASSPGASQSTGDASECGFPTFEAFCSHGAYCGADPKPETWCNRAPFGPIVEFSTNACDGVVAVSVVYAEAGFVYLYDEKTNELLEIQHAGGESCEAKKPGFVPPTGCQWSFSNLCY